MTAERDKTSDLPAAAVAQPAAPSFVSRRMLLRGAYVAVPTILTLNSKTAAAWAVASGTISAKLTRDGGDGLCLLGNTPLEPGPKLGQYYLPENPVVVNVSGSYDYTSTFNGVESARTAEDLCELGGDNIKYRLKTNLDGAYTEGPARFGPGVLVSSTAAASFGIVGTLPDDL